MVAMPAAVPAPQPQGPHLATLCRVTTVSHRQEPIETERLIRRRFEDDLGFVAELERDQYAITRAEWLRMLPR